MLDWPEIPRVKSKPIPDSGICNGTASAPLAAVKVPVCSPAVNGAKAICRVQAAPGSREEPQVVDAIAKAAEVARLRFVSARRPLFVSVSAFDVAVSPTPVEGNAREPG